MVEGGDLEVELPGQVEHLRHLVGAVAVDVHEDVAGHRAGQRLELEVALTRLLALALLRVLLRVDQRGAVAGHVAHARGRAALLAVDALGILAAGHLQPVRRVGELHLLRGGGGDVPERHAAPADQVGRTGQDLQGGHAAGQRRAEARVLRPHRVLGPDLGGDRGGRLVAVAVRAGAGAGVYAQMRVHVDQAGGHPLAAAVDADRAGVGRQPVAHRGDLAVAQQHVGVVQPPAIAGEHGRAGDQHRRRGDRPVGAGEGGGGLSGGGGRGVAGRLGTRASGEQGCAHGSGQWSEHGGLRGMDRPTVTAGHARAKRPKVMLRETMRDRRSTR